MKGFYDAAKKRIKKEQVYICDDPKCYNIFDQRSDQFILTGIKTKTSEGYSHKYLKPVKEETTNTRNAQTQSRNALNRTTGRF